VTFTTRPELSGRVGMVASTHWLASGAGMAVLEAGGNAFDAAVAAGFVLQVVEPHMNGPGGEVPIIAWSAARGAPFVVCGQGVAPAAAGVQRLRALGHDAVPGTGVLAACVPGAFDGWMHLLAEHGTWRLGAVLGYAIEYAGGGFPALPAIAATIERVRGRFEAEWPASAELWLGHGAELRNPLLAATYGRLVAEAEAATGDRDGQIEHARAAWRTGWIAEAIVAHGGLLAEADLAGWRATEEAPVTFDYCGHTVCKTGPWGQGPVFLQQLALLADVDVPGLAPDALAHRVIEGAKLAFADREAYYGDAGPVPIAMLLSPAYAAERRALIRDEASYELRPGGASPRLPTTTGGAAGVGTGDPTRGDTCHVDVADRHGNLVAATPSGGWLQSSPAIPGLGFALGTRAQMFRLEDGLPSSLVGGTRPRTTLSPSLVLRDGEGHLAFGTPGGDQQDQWSLLFLINHVDLGMGLQEAIDAPMLHSNHFPSSFFPRAARPGHVEVEARAPVIAALRRRGHDVEVTGPWSLGRVSAVARDPDGVLRAAANPRGMQGYAVGR
jgi:gamma-glutamyltranspeptidase/glutathione hydrolase